jgi:UDPglucose 6-dehydrogenase
MKVGIIGYGFVGKALASGIKKNVDVLKIDPILNNDIEDLVEFNADICFICVPTPMNDDGSQNIDILVEVIKKIKSQSIKSVIVIKSTILPNHINKFKKLIPNLVINPEFLRERHAHEDFINSNLILLGGKEQSTKIVSNFYKKYTKCKSKQHKFTDVTSASLIKYSINTFLSLKVVFFNQLYEILLESDSSMEWENFIDIISIDDRIGKSHMKVPGVDGKFGFGGACFPKDCNALIKYSEDIGKPFDLLKKSSEINNGIRKKYGSLDNREEEQNINYNT